MVVKENIPKSNVFFRFKMWVSEFDGNPGTARKKGRCMAYE